MECTGHVGSTKHRIITKVDVDVLMIRCKKCSSSSNAEDINKNLVLRGNSGKGCEIGDGFMEATILKNDTRRSTYESYRSYASAFMEKYTKGTNLENDTSGRYAMTLNNGR